MIEGEINMVVFPYCSSKLLIFVLTYTLQDHNDKNKQHLNDFNESLKSIAPCRT